MISYFGIILAVKLSLFWIINIQNKDQHFKATESLIPTKELPHSANRRLIHHLKQTSHHPSLPLSSIPDLKRTCSTNPSHHRSSSYPPTAHWTSTGLPSRTSYHPALCFSSSVIFLLVDACVGLDWLLVSFLSHVNINIIHSFIHSFSALAW